MGSNAGTHGGAHRDAHQEAGHAQQGGQLELLVACAREGVVQGRQYRFQERKLRGGEINNDFEFLRYFYLDFRYCANCREGLSENLGKKEKRVNDYDYIKISVEKKKLKSYMNLQESSGIHTQYCKEEKKRK